MCVYEVHVDGARVGYGVEYCLLCNLVKNNALCAVNGQIEHLCQVPCNGLSLAVFIGCQPHGFGTVCEAREFIYKFALVCRYLIEWLVLVIYIYAETLLRKVTNMSEARLHGVLFAEKLLDSLGFGG